MFSVFVPSVRRLLRDQDVSLVFVDIGSRNGIIELEEIADSVDAYGFEPNPEEYQKLITGTTDLERVTGRAAPRFRRVIFSPYALASRCGQMDFYITRGPGSCGLLEPDCERLREIKWKGCVFPNSLGEELFRVVRTIPTQVRTLDWFCSDQTLQHIDYLKIDVEGSEYDVLSGGTPILPRVGVIKVEVSFIPFRKGQKLFSDVDLLLRTHGFDLLRYEIDPGQVGYKERVFPFNHGPSLGFPDPFGQPLQCDAIYVNRHVTDRQRLLAQAAVLIEKNYLDEALFILKNKVRLEAEPLLEQLRTYRGKAVSRAARTVVQLLRWVKSKLAAAG